MRAFIRAKAEPFADEIREDTIGNVLVFKRGKRSSARPLMLCAHMDEVGLVVKRITEGGGLLFGSAGSIDPRLLAGKRVRKGDLFGVIGLPPIHLSSKEEREKPLSIEKLCIDIGAAGRAEAQRLVQPGDAFAFDTEPECFGDGFFKGKALDDRLGCAVLLRLLESELPEDTWFAFTVQEEVGARGAFSAAYTLAPRAALIIEGTTAADYPGLSGTERVAAAGEGVVLSYTDGGTYYDRALFLELRDLCEKNAVPYQLKRVVAGGTDGAIISRSRDGIPVVGLSAAVRYIHAPASVVSLRDIGHILKAARLFLEKIAPADKE